MASSIEEFLSPLNVDVEKIHGLARRMRVAFEKLAAASTDQFLSTPISESVLRPDEGDERGRYVLYKGHFHLVEIDFSKFVYFDPLLGVCSCGTRLTR